MTSPALLGAGTLARAAPGVMEGTAEFPVRGTFPLVLDLLTRVEGQHVARLRVGGEGDRVAEFRGDPLAGEAPTFWHGYVVVDGYEMRVRIVPGREAWSVEFWDCKQRIPWREVAA